MTWRRMDTVRQPTFDLLLEARGATYRVRRLGPDIDHVEYEGREANARAYLQGMARAFAITRGVL